MHFNFKCPVLLSQYKTMEYTVSYGCSLIKEAMIKVSKAAPAKEHAEERYINT